MDADKFLKIAIGLGSLIAGAGVAYHYAVSLPASSAAAAELVKVRQEDYDSCVGDAATSYIADWQQNCKILGKSPYCSLPTKRANELEESSKDEQKRCLAEFKAGV